MKATTTLVIVIILIVVCAVALFLLFGQSGGLTGKTIPYPKAILMNKISIVE